MATVTRLLGQTLKLDDCDKIVEMGEMEER
jgi:hypothetical protein